MRAERAITGGNGRQPTAEETKLREHQGLPDRPHKGGLAVVKKEEPSRFSLSAYQATLIFIIVQTFSFGWFISGLNSQVGQLIKDKQEMQSKLEIADAKIYSLTVKFAEYKGASAFARFIDAMKEEEDAAVPKPKKESK